MEKTDKFYLGPSALAAIVAVIQKGLIEGSDVSQELRDLRFIAKEGGEKISLASGHPMIAAQHQLDVSRD